QHAGGVGALSGIAGVTGNFVGRSGEFFHGGSHQFDFMQLLNSGGDGTFGGIGHGAYIVAHLVVHLNHVADNAGDMLHHPVEVVGQGGDFVSAVGGQTTGQIATAIDNGGK